MGLGVGLILAAVGAVLAFAVNATVSGVDIHTIGWILLIVGIVGILLSLIFWSSWAGPGGFPPPDARRITTRALPARLVPADPRTRRDRSKRDMSRCLAPGHVRTRPRQATGSSRKNDDPVRPSESTQIRPFIRSTSSRVM